MADLGIELEAHCDRILKRWVDASYGFHPNLKSHTGMTFMLEKRLLYNMYNKQMINTCSSTEAELLGVNDKLNHILLTQKSLCQG